MPQLVNVSHFDGLLPDFSNLLVEISAANQTHYPQFQIAAHEPSRWAMVNISIPDGETEYALNFYADNASAPPSNSSALLLQQAPLQHPQPNESQNSTNNTQVLFTFTFNNLPSGAEATNVTEGNMTYFYYNLTNSSIPNTGGYPDFSGGNGTENQTATEGTNNAPLQIQQENNYTNISAQPFPSSPEFNTSSNQTSQLNFTGNGSIFGNGSASGNESVIIFTFNFSTGNITGLELNNSTGENGTTGYYFNLTEGGITNSSENTTGADENASIGGNLSGLLPPPQQGESRLNVSFFDGLLYDFSNLIVQLVLSNSSLIAQHGILAFSPAEWAIINFTAPPEPHTINLFAYSENGSLTLPQNNSSLFYQWLNLSQNITANGTFNVSPNVSILPLMNETNITDINGENFTGMNCTEIAGDAGNGAGIAHWECSNGEGVRCNGIPGSDENGTAITLWNCANTTNLADAPQVAPEVARRLPRIPKGNSQPALLDSDDEAIAAGDADGRFHFGMRQYGEGLPNAYYASSPAYDVGYGDFAVSAQFSTTSQQEGVLVYRGSYNEGRYYELKMNPEGTLSFTLGDGSQTVQAQAPGIYNDGKWHQVSAARTGGALLIYVDGIESASAPAPPMDLSCNGVLSIGSNMGGYEFAKAPSYVFNGVIADPIIWDHAVSGADSLAASMQADWE